MVIANILSNSKYVSKSISNINGSLSTVLNRLLLHEYVNIAKIGVQCSKEYSLILILN